jgi:hypothetical protein
MTQYSAIQRTEYNTIQAQVAKVLGSTSSQVTFGATDDDYGYGQTVSSSQVPANTLITAKQWNDLTNDVLRCLWHQTAIDKSGVFVSSGSVNGDPVTSGYPYYQTVNTTATATAVTTNYITVGTTVNMRQGMTIVFTGTNFGNLVSGFTYYILTVVNSTQITITNAPLSNSSTALVLITATGSMTVVAGGTLGQFILDVDRSNLYAYTISGNAANISTNRLVKPSSGVGVTYPQASLYQYAVNNQLPAVHIAPFTGQIAHTITVAFGSHAAARYFFNAGGRIIFNASCSGYTIANPGYALDATWTSMFNAMDTYYFAARTTGITGTATPAGGGGPGTTYSADNYGFYGLSTSPATVFSLYAPSSSVYHAINYDIDAYYDRNGNLYFTVRFNDAYTATPPWGITESTDGVITSFISAYYPNGLDANGNTTVTLPYPSASSTQLA